MVGSAKRPSIELIAVASGDLAAVLRRRQRSGELPAPLAEQRPREDGKDHQTRLQNGGDDAGAVRVLPPSLPGSVSRSAYGPSASTNSIGSIYRRTRRNLAPQPPRDLLNLDMPERGPTCCNDAYARFCFCRRRNQQARAERCDTWGAVHPFRRCKRVRGAG